MKGTKLVDARLEFPPASLPRVLEVFLSLPGELCPTHHNVGEDEHRALIGDREKFHERIVEKGSGLFLYGPRASYDVRPGEKSPVICNGFDIPAPLAAAFLTHMAKAHPTFGYACAADEEERRNRLKTKFGSNTVESWLGRKTEKHIPGLYWLTLLPEALAERHHVPLAAVEEISLEHVDLGGGQHLFRFYEQPEDWRPNSAVEQLCESLPGFFDISKPRSQVGAGKNFHEHMAELAKWD